MKNDEIHNTTEETNTYSSDTKRIALITGITGQDGSYLTELLLSKGYMVHGIIRRSSTLNTSRIDQILLNNNSNCIKIHYGDLTDSLNLNNLINEINPDEVYNLGALSHVKVSFDLPETTTNINALGTLRLLEAIKNNSKKKIKFYQASTSELFGKVQEVPQKESTPFYPRSPYGVAKIYAYWTTINYREAYGMFAANGILFNHESPRRGHNFVTRKITRSVAQIYLNKQEFITLGNLDSKRDWGHAKDYVEAMWLMLQKDEPEDFVISTNETHTIREFVETAFREINKEIIWKGSAEDEIGVEKDTGKIRIKIDPKFYRPTEVHILLGDSSKAEEKLNWKRKISFKDLVKEMVESDIKLMKDSSSYHDFE